MRRIVALFISAGLMVGAAATAAEAMPIAPAGFVQDTSTVTLVSGGCGPMAHRGPYGRCRPNRFFGRPGYYPPVRRCFIRPTPFGPRRVCRY